MRCLRLLIVCTLGAGCSTETPAPAKRDELPPPAKAPEAKPVEAPLPPARVDRVPVAKLPEGTSERAIEAKELEHDGRVFRVGARVRLAKRDRALDPDETGHGASIAYGPGQVGAIVRFVHRRSEKHDVEFDMAVVRWDAQTWSEWDIPLHRMKPGVAYSGEDLNRMNQENGRAVEMPSFELAAHPETLAIE